MIKAILKYYSLLLFLLFSTGLLYLVKVAESQTKFKKKFKEIPKGQNESFILTNSVSTYFFGETGQMNSSDFQGLNVSTIEYLDDYIIEVNGRVLNRRNAEVTLYSDKIVRTYTDYPLTEEVTLMDSLPVLVIKLVSGKKLPITFLPVISGITASRRDVAFWAGEDKFLYIRNRSLRVSQQVTGDEYWSGIFVFPEAEYVKVNPDIKKFYVGHSSGQGFLPGKLTSFIDNPVYIFVIIGEGKKDIIEKRKTVLNKLKLYNRETNKKIDGVRKT